VANNFTENRIDLAYGLNSIEFDAGIFVDHMK